MKIAIATTTIFPIQVFLKEYLNNFRIFGREREISIYIAGDRKSPIECSETAKKYRSYGLNAFFLDINQQNEYLKKYPDLGAIIPENSDNRRNVAFLWALKEGADLIISVDDDNFPLKSFDFIGEHLSVGQTFSEEMALGSNGWFNLCSLLNPEIPDTNLYPRGFPYKRRCIGTEKIEGKCTGKVGINVGLWTKDPDTDAIGRLYARPIINDWKGKSVILGKRVLTPINSQNTALSRSAMVAYYYVNMGSVLRGMRLDRFGDIFSGYFVQLCAKSVGDAIRIGSPIAEHRRNKHNLFVDLYNELAGIMILEDMTTFFEKVELPCDSYFNAYQALSIELEKFTNSVEGFIWVDETRTYFRKISQNMRIWADIVAEIGK
jgi:hypothetical protein